MTHKSKSSLFALAMLAGLTGEPSGAPAGDRARLTVVFDNVAYRKDLKTSWGFSCLVETGGKTILFDTGNSARTLLSNMKALSLDPGKVDAVVLSHNHGDHTGGLEGFLAQSPRAAVYAPASFPRAFWKALKARSVEARPTAEPTTLFPGVHTTGEMGRSLVEQGLVVETSRGPVLLTGCAHPGIENMARQVARRFPGGIHLLMGGFHLMNHSRRELEGLCRELRDLGVRRVAPSHCTGDEARRIFKETWGEDFVESGAGAVIEAGEP